MIPNYLHKKKKVFQRLTMLSPINPTTTTIILVTNPLLYPQTILLHSRAFRSNKSCAMSIMIQQINQGSYDSEPAQQPYLESAFCSSLGLDFNTHTGGKAQKRHGLIVRAGKPALCLTKRNRSRKSLARTHGFRVRMRTTSGRAILKRRRAKGRWVLCTKSNPNSGKRHL